MTLPPRHTCEICGSDFWASFARGRPWDGASPCPCGGGHRACLTCSCRYDLLDDGEWGEGKIPLKTCPASDEFRVALETMGPGVVVEPQPRGAR